MKLRILLSGLVLIGFGAWWWFSPKQVVDRRTDQVIGFFSKGVLSANEPEGLERDFAMVVAENLVLRMEGLPGLEEVEMKLEAGEALGLLKSFRERVVTSQVDEASRSIMVGSGEVMVSSRGDLVLKTLAGEPRLEKYWLDLIFERGGSYKLAEVRVSWPEFDPGN